MHIKLQIRMLAEDGQGIETEQYMEKNKTIAATCYYGGLVGNYKREE